jgi:hypothetical protein
MWKLSLPRVGHLPAVRRELAAPRELLCFEPAPRGKFSLLPRAGLTPTFFQELLSEASSLGDFELSNFQAYSLLPAQGQKT